MDIKEILIIIKTKKRIISPPFLSMTIIRYSADYRDQKKKNIKEILIIIKKKNNIIAAVSLNNKIFTADHTRQYRRTRYHYKAQTIMNLIFWKNFFGDIQSDYNRPQSGLVLSRPVVTQRPVCLVLSCQDLWEEVKNTATENSVSFPKRLAEIF